MQKIIRIFCCFFLISNGRSTMDHHHHFYILSNSMFSYLLFCLSILLSWNSINGQAPYEYYGSVDSNTNDLISPFMQSSLENIQLFKTKVFKLIEAQNQYFELIQQKRPAVGDYECNIDSLLTFNVYFI